MYCFMLECITNVFLKALYNFSAYTPLLQEIINFLLLNFLPWLVTPQSFHPLNQKPRSPPGSSVACTFAPAPQHTHPMDHKSRRP